MTKQVGGRVMHVCLAIVGSIRTLRGDDFPVIRRYIAMLKPAVIISGECPYGGVDEVSLGDPSSFHAFPRSIGYHQ